MADQRVMEKDWTEVVLTLVYVDGKKAGAQRLRLTLAEVEAQEKASAMARIEAEIPVDHPAREDAVRSVEEWSLTPEEFKAQVLKQANRLVTAPVMVPGEEPHVVRLLPLAAHQGVVIEVVNQESRVIRPS